MRCRYREKIYECGDYIEVNLYPVYKQAHSRRKKSKPTREVQKKLNEIYAENKLIRLCNANFTGQDLKVELTYDSKHHPADDEEAAASLRNFLRRLKRYREKQGLPELKYIAVTEQGKLRGRYHHHLIISGGVPVPVLDSLWKRGIVTSAPLHFNENGLADLARYMLKRSVASGKRWNSSKNLIHPKARQRDGRLSQAKVNELARDTENAREFEKHYPDYYFSEARAIMSDITGGTYIYARFYKKEAEFLCKHTRARR